MAAVAGICATNPADISGMHQELIGKPHAGKGGS
jgi:hypothetical protein